jgi:hypothetical protein
VSEKDDFISFDKALRDLKLRSEELRKLVSEGEIRAFRDGPDSMKFRREDVEGLATKRGGDEELAFADSLEDDTGMVTEQITADDTLIADDEPEAPRASKRPARPAAAPRAMAAAAAGEQEPGWVTAVAVLGFLILVWGFVVNYSIAQESDPNGNMFTSAFAEK